MGKVIRGVEEIRAAKIGGTFPLYKDFPPASAEERLQA
jgi:hypothetical protein